MGFKTFIFGMLAGIGTYASISGGCQPKTEAPTTGAQAQAPVAVDNSKYEYPCTINDNQIFFTHSNGDPKGANGVMNSLRESMPNGTVILYQDNENDDLKLEKIVLYQPLEKKEERLFSKDISDSTNADVRTTTYSITVPEDSLVMQRGQARVDWLLKEILKQKEENGLNMIK